MKTSPASRTDDQEQEKGRYARLIFHHNDAADNDACGDHDRHRDQDLVNDPGNE